VEKFLSWVIVVGFHCIIFFVWVIQVEYCIFLASCDHAMLILQDLSSAYVRVTLSQFRGPLNVLQSVTHTLLIHGAAAHDAG
jgi:hypothetical protein